MNLPMTKWWTNEPTYDIHGGLMNLPYKLAQIEDKLMTYLITHMDKRAYLMTHMDKWTYLMTHMDKWTYLMTYMDKWTYLMAHGQMNLPSDTWTNEPTLWHRWPTNERTLRHTWWTNEPTLLNRWWTNEPTLWQIEDKWTCFMTRGQTNLRYDTHCGQNELSLWHTWRTNEPTV